MREIKFRAWDKKQRLLFDVGGLWAFRDAGRDDENGESVFANENYGTYSDAEFEFMQYTGLKDRHDVEIYEGDIVTLNDGYGRETGEVEFDRAMFYVAGASINLGDLESNQIEVRGNKWESPELLNGKES